MEGNWDNFEDDDDIDEIKIPFVLDVLYLHEFLVDLSQVRQQQTNCFVVIEIKYDDDVTGDGGEVVISFWHF